MVNLSHFSSFTLDLDQVKVKVTARDLKALHARSGAADVVIYLGSHCIGAASCSPQYPFTIEDYKLWLSEGDLFDMWPRLTNQQEIVNLLTDTCFGVKIRKEWVRTVEFPV